ncbi:MAG: MBL fold metallo-hydrolase [Anaerolineales bacterium]
MLHISDHLYQLERVPMCNVYLVDAGVGYYLVDSGLFGYAKAIMEELEGAGYPLSNLKGILHTHGHGDHIGNTAALVERSGTPVLGHEADLAFFQKTPKPPAKSPLQRIMLRLMDRTLFRQPPTPLDAFLQEGDEIQMDSKWEVIHTPGHTPGSISFYQPQQGVLLCGDALFNQHPMTRVKGLRLPLPLVSFDDRASLASAQQIANLDVRILCPGHGLPLREHVNLNLERLFKANT